MSLRYSMRIQWSAQDECFVGFVPEFTGCLAFGPSHVACVENLLTVIKVMLRNHEAAGVEPEPPRVSADSFARHREIMEAMTEALLIEAADRRKAKP